MLARLIKDALAWATFERPGKAKGERPGGRAMPDALHQRGARALREGRLQEALGLLEQANALRDDDAERHKLLGDVLRRMWRLDEAAQHYRQAIRLDPGHADAHNNLGVVLSASGSPGEATACFHAALALDVTLAEAHVNLGNALREQGRIEAAIASFREAIRVRPDYALAYNNLAILYREEGKFEQARRCDDRVLALQPNDGTRIKRALTLPVVSRSREQIAEARDTLRREVTALLERGVRLSDPLEQVGETSFRLPYHGLNDKDLQCLIARLYEQACPALRYVAPHCASIRRLPSRRRVGFLSRHFFNHSVGAWFSRLIDRLAAEGAIDPVLVTVGSVEETVLRSTFPSLREHLAIPFNLDRARAQVAALGLDLLVYTDIGMDPLSYYLAFSRLAPVQCAMLGHPVTSGIPNVDYFISSGLMEPDGAESHYSESLVRVDALPAYIARPALPPARGRAALGLSEDRRAYVCPTMLHKLHPDFDQAIAGILRRDPKGEVILFEDSLHRHWHRSLLERFGVTLPDVIERVRFVPWLPADALMSVLMSADVALDTFHFGAATTTFLVLATGTPIVTLPAAFARGRATLACYRRIGVDDCIARTPEEFVSLAVQIATDRAHRAELSARIRERSGALYDDPRLVSEMTRLMISLEPVPRPAAG